MVNLYGKIWLSVAVIFLCTLVNGCEVSIPGPLYQTVETADQASDFFQDLCKSGEWPAEAESFLDYVQTLEEVEEAHLADNSEYFTVLYRSGVFHIFYCEPEDERSEESALTVKTDRDGPGPIHVSGFPNQTSPEASAAFYPTSGAVGTAIRSSAQQVLQAFEAAGYTTEALQEPTLEWFRSWNQYGIIYLTGHAGVDNYPDSDTHSERGQPFEYIYTTTPYIESGVEGNPHESDLATDARRLVYSTTARYRTFAVTPRFFNYHYQAGNPDNPDATALPNSIIYLDTCHTLDNTTGANRLAPTLVGCGAQMILGWEGRVRRGNAAETAAFFFDRLCGLSQVEADDLDPPTRPFTVQQIYSYLFDEGRNIQPGGVRLVYYPTATGSTAARPVISSGYYLTAGGPMVPGVDPSITLLGYFGPAQGEVLFNDTPLSRVILWEEGRIVAYLPNDNTTGDVKVRVNNLESNPMRLWGFSGSTTWQVNEAGKYTGTITSTFEGRVLLQLMRSEVDGDAATPRGPIPLDGCIYASERGQLAWNISGTWVDSSDNHHSLQAQGNASIAPQYLVDTGTPGMLCMIVFELDPDAANATYKIQLAAGVTGTDTVTEPEGAQRDEPWFGGSGTPLLDTSPLPSSWVVPAGNLSGEDFQLNWTEISPDTSPTSLTDPDYPYPA